MGQEEEQWITIGEQRHASEEEVEALERESRSDEDQKQRAPSEEEVRRYGEEESRQRHPTEDEVSRLEEETQEGQSGDDD